MHFLPSTGVPARGRRGFVLRPMIISVVTSEEILGEGRGRGMRVDGFGRPGGEMWEDEDVVF